MLGEGTFAEGDYIVDHVCEPFEVCPVAFGPPVSLVIQCIHLEAFSCDQLRNPVIPPAVLSKSVHHQHQPFKGRVLGLLPPAIKLNGPLVAAPGVLAGEDPLPLWIDEELGEKPVLIVAYVRSGRVAGIWVAGVAYRSAARRLASLQSPLQGGQELG